LPSRNIFSASELNPELMHSFVDPTKASLSSTRENGKNILALLESWGEMEIMWEENLDKFKKSLIIFF
jgi:hypothetical protein